jgi:UDP-3-O-acyl-N-acetylglucosamine deacetylase
MTDTEKRDAGDVFELLEESQTDGCTLSGEDCRMVLDYIDNRISTIEHFESALIDIGIRARKARAKAPK